MKVFFNSYGQLRHHQCDGHVVTCVQDNYSGCPIVQGEEWEFTPQFYADIDLGGAEDSWGVVKIVRCRRCGESIPGELPGPMDIELVTPLLCYVCDGSYYVDRMRCGMLLCEGCAREHLKECVACMSDSQAAKYA